MKKDNPDTICALNLLIPKLFGSAERGEGSRSSAPFLKLVTLGSVPWI